MAKDDGGAAEFVAKLKAFEQAGYELSGAWDGLDPKVWDRAARDYPFEDSFDDLQFKIGEWSESARKAIAEVMHS